MTDALSLCCISMCCKVLYFILSEDDFEIKSKIYSLKLRLVLNYILNSQDVLYFRNLFFTIARYIITITSTYTQSKTVLFPYSLLINIKGLGGWDAVKLR
jgi:hypothetical protein